MLINVLICFPFSCYQMYQCFYYLLCTCANKFVMCTCILFNILHKIIQKNFHFLVYFLK